MTAELYREATRVYLHRTLRAAEPDDGLTTRVRRGLAFLYLFTVNGSHSNRVLLLPTFIFGCAVFNIKERQPIETVFDSLAASNDFGNVEPLKKIVQEVWGLMDNNGPRSWDLGTITTRHELRLPHRLRDPLGRFPNVVEIARAAKIAEGYPGGITYYSTKMML